MQIDPIIKSHWLRRRAMNGFSWSPCLDERGLALGAGSKPVRVTAAEHGVLGLDLDADYDRLIALAAIVFRGDLRKTFGLAVEKAAKAWPEGDGALANTLLAHARLPRLRSEYDGYRLFPAETLLDAGSGGSRPWRDR